MTAGSASVHQVTIKPRWRAQIEGDAEAIANLARVLNDYAGSADRHVLIMGAVPMLTTTQWDKLPDVDQAQVAAETALRLFTGALNVFDVCPPLAVGTMFEVRPDGTVQQSRTARFEEYVMAALPDRVTPDEFDRIMRLSGRHEWLAGALLEMSSTVDWFAIFRTIEAIEKHLGGERAMTARQDINGRALKLGKQMANSFRHFPDRTHLPPNPPMTLHEARMRVREALKVLIRDLP